MSKGRVVSGVVLFTVCAGAGLRAGQAPQGQRTPAPSEVVEAVAPTPTFKATVEYVEVDVVVTDAQGKPVRDLSRDDFQVFEDGKRQAISNFTVVSIPTEPRDEPQRQFDVVAPDTASNERPFNGRLYVAVLDNVAFLRSQQARNAARLFIERNLSANDLMAVVSTAGPRAGTQEFTSNKRLLLDAVERFAGQKSVSPIMALNEAYLRQRNTAEASRGTVGIDPDLVLREVRGGGYDATALMNVIDWFGGIRGRRKTMLLFSEGVPNDIKQMMGQDALRSIGTAADFEGMQGAIAAATRANVSIYTIDPRGLTTMGDDDITVSSFANVPFAGMNLGQAGLNDERRREQQSLQIVAEETGGVAFVNTNQFADAFDRIVDDNSAYYVLAYYPPSNKRDGKFHKIEVKTTRRGLTVRSRKGYQAPRGNAKPAKPGTEAGRPSPELQQALDSPIPVSGLPMRMFAAPFKGTAPNASVLFGVELVGRSLALAQNGTIEFSYAAVDAQGKTRASSTDTFTTRLSPETQARVRQSGFRMLHRITLPPGRYAMRLAARDAAAATTGSLTYDLEVPDFSKPALSLSGVLLTSMSGSAMVTAKGDDQTKAVLPASPIATRTFPQNDEIALFAEIYDNQTGPAHRVDISTTLKTDDGRVLFTADDERDSSELQGGKAGYGYARRIPLSGIPPGPYVLRVQAKSRLGDDEGVSRELRVIVTPPATPAR